MMSYVRKYAAALAVLVLSSCNAHAAGPQVPAAGSLTGRVASADGKPLAGVVVSDGVRVTQTDTEGMYTLDSDKELGYVFISIPSGYMTAADACAIPQFFARTAKPAGQSERHDFTLTPVDNTRHTVIAATDHHLADRESLDVTQFTAEGGFIDDVKAVAAATASPVYSICMGDMSWDEYWHKRNFMLPEFRRLYERYTFPCPVFNAMGNHDMKIWGRSYETSLGPFEAMYGPCYYSYNVGRVHYVVLNDNFFVGRDWYYIGYLEERQLAWLAKDLQYVPAGSTVVAALHIPTMYKNKENQPFDYKMAERSLCNYRALYALLKPYKAHIVSGHMHTTTNSDICEGLYEHNVAALSGAWWQGAICTDGTPAGYGVFEVDGDDVQWRYKATGYPQEFQIKIYGPSDDPAFAGRIVANVWNCDPAWIVEMRVDGCEPVAMARTTAIDPEARALYADTSKLVHKWITVIPSDHYYAAPLPAGARRVEVTARDRFGNVYRAEKEIVL